VFLAGVTKLYTTALVLRLAERGRLTLDDPNSTVLPRPVIRDLHRIDGTDHTSALTFRHRAATFRSWKSGCWSREGLRPGPGTVPGWRP
jgi:CubicO group peptidase (beta-lactamase class C family)